MIEFEEDEIYKKHNGKWFIWDGVDVKEITSNLCWKFAKGQCEHEFKSFLYAKICTKCHYDERMCQ